jgi:hypothetical protein
MVRVQSGPPPLAPPGTDRMASLTVMIPATVPTVQSSTSRPTFESQLSRLSVNSDDFVILDPSPTGQEFGAPAAPSPPPPPPPVQHHPSAPFQFLRHGSFVCADRFLTGEAALDLCPDELQSRLRNLLAENKLLQETIHQSNLTLRQQVKASAAAQMQS